MTGAAASRYGNIEPIARELCARGLMEAGVERGEIKDLVERFWPAVAAELAAGLRDDDGRIVPHTAAVGIAAWGSWLDDHYGRVSAG